MKIDRERCTRMTLFAVLALFTLLLIGSEHRKEAAAAAKPAPTPEDIALLREIRDLLKENAARKS